MRTFSHLLEELVLTPSRNGKLDLLADHFAREADPDRGYALAAITGDLDIPAVKGATLRAIAAERVDAELFALSYDFVGDLAETIALIWPTSGTDASAIPSLGDVVESLQAASRPAALKLTLGWLDAMEAGDRYALVKLATGGLRIGVSARLAKQALAQFAESSGQTIPIEDIEEIWPAQKPPYRALFAWLEGKGERPSGLALAPFRPVMLAHPLDEAALPDLPLSQFQIEWKWDGIRVQAVSDRGQKRLFSRTGDDISAAFPDIIEAMDFEGALDGELLVARMDAADGPSGKPVIGSFGDLQQRLNRKTVSAANLRDHPAFMRVYDLLVDGDQDLRKLPLAERRARLQRFITTLNQSRFDMSEVLHAETLEALATLRRTPPHGIIEGLMLKRLDSIYEAGRPKGPWFKWKRDPMSVDVVMIYAQRGHGKRSGFYSDFTFAAWTKDPDDGGQLVPVGKAYSGFTDEELKKLDKFVRDNTTERFGPVRGVTANKDFGLVLEIAFEGINQSARHKSGVAMRFPRISRIRWDKPAREADRLETLQKLIG
jgi:DNA ligase 1